MSRRFRDPAAPLCRALVAHAAAAGCPARAVAVDSRAWSSAVFTGTRHRILVTGPALDRWSARLPDADALALPRQWLGELRVERVAPGTVSLSALVLDA